MAYSDDLIYSLSILKVNWDVRRDYIENFVPFAAESLRLSGAKELALGEVQTKIGELFGLRIPQAALRTILARVASRGYVRIRENRYFPNARQLSSLNFDDSRKLAIQQTQGLIGKLRTFAKDRHGEEISEETAESVLFEFLSDSLDLAIAVTFGNPDAASGSAESLSRTSRFLVENFILHLHESDAEGFLFLETVVKGSILAKTLYFAELGNIAKRFRDIRVFLDTSVMLPALGLGSSTQFESTRELMDLVWELGGKLSCFEHTLDEIRRVLDFVISQLQRGAPPINGHDSIIEHCTAARISASDVELMKGKLEQLLASLRVRIERRPPVNPPLGVDEKFLEVELRENMDHKTPEALLHDLESLTAVHRFRGGRIHRDIENCKAIFVTTSKRLAAVSSSFFKEHLGETTAPHCITASSFTTLVWLKKPLKAPNLPMKSLVAICYAALNPPDAIWSSFLGELERLRLTNNLTQEDYYRLRYSSAAKQALRWRRLHDPSEEIDHHDVQDILQQVRQWERYPVEERLRAELDKRGRAEAAERQANSARLDAERSAVEMSRVNAELAARVATLEELHASAATVAKVERESRLAQSISFQGRVRLLAGRTARVIRITLLGLGVALLTVFVVSTLPPTLLPLPRGFTPYLSIAAALGAAVLAFLTVANIGFGYTINDHCRRVERRVADLLEDRILRLIGLSRSPKDG